MTGRDGPWVGMSKSGRGPDETDDRVGFVLAAQTVEAGFWIDEQDVPDHVDAESDLPIRL